MKINKLPEVNLTWEDFVARVNTYKKAKEEHKSTIGVPAPLEDPNIMAAASADTIEQGMGWVPEEPYTPPKPTNEKFKERLLNEIYALYSLAETSNLSAAGVMQLTEWCSVGNSKALDVKAWLSDLYNERDIKLAAVESGDLNTDPTPSHPWKPWSFREIAGKI